MQNQLKELNENILPKAFQMLEDDMSISEVRIELGDSVDPKMKNIFLNRLNFYVKNKFRVKYNLLKNILLVLFSLFIGLMVYMRVLDFLNNPEIFTTFYKILNILLLLFFVNLIWKLFNWEGSYIRSVLVLMIIFSLGDLFELSSSYNNITFISRFILQLLSGGIAFFLYRKIFPTHGFRGAPKENVKEKNILDDFR